ncbi:MAG TPA: transcriptional regulator GcvA [Paracoccus sp. (in: a-proteobacteria)]|uniref:transcriptional regulator GcvA n=1 Tax=uncultured Paracoccus sp. TaxID=189685 RepID=UPI00261A00EC|nr:transcriptional regulator GcvA [uncultured Paracoccus sp.]HMQ39954.1 transcriptional regulator GcvA [Paracoccus sp. (in: a-proteobacteria)]HMR37453.1 transcriptional regulator GcvA [Paracoccus sp. (in: a-proteobacteria)]
MDQPPLTALRAFEAAARHLSFSRAAEELHVTPAALSFQIKQLEAHLGQPVFQRAHRSLSLTPLGQTLLPGIRAGFEQIAAAWHEAQRSLSATRLVLTAGPAFTSKWLSPRLFGFARAHPEIELRLVASLRLMDLERDGIDIAIRYGLPGGQGQVCHDLMPHDWHAPMMSPEMAERFPTPESLHDAPLLHMHDLDFIKPTPDWPGWFRAAGLGKPPPGGAAFSHHDHAIDAAVGGAGIIIGRWSVSHDHLAAGRLVAPFPLSLTGNAAFRFLCRSGQEDRPHIRAFRDWLDAEIAQMDPMHEGRIFLDDW